jgi:phage-related protein
MISIIKTIIALLPILRDLINAAEAFFPEKGAGYQRLEFVKALFQTAYETASKVEQPFSALWPVVEKVIALLVPVFTKKTETVTSPVAATVSFTPKTEAAFSGIVNTLKRDNAVQLTDNQA